MAKPWSQVMASPQFQSLSEDEAEAARNQYFDQVVAPQIGDPSQVSVARSQFDAQTGPSRWANVQAGVTQRRDAPAKPVNPSLFRMDSDFREKAGIGVVPMLTAAAKDMFGFREGAAETLAEAANKERGVAGLIGGGARVVKDERGEPAIRLPSGETYRLNDPGIDTTDVANIAGNVGAFLTPAGWAARVGQARNLGLGARSLLQAGTAAGTDVAIQAAANEGKIDPSRTALTAAGGAGGELLGAGLSAAFNRLAAAARARGPNLADARKFAQDAGIQAPSAEQVKSLSGAMEEIRAGADPRTVLGRSEYGFLYTKGQQLPAPRNFPQLAREELLRQQPGAGEVLREAERKNVGAIETALGNLSQKYGAQAGATPAELAQGAATRVSQQADELGERITQAYKRAGEGGRTAIAPEAVRGLPQRLQAAVRDFAPNATTTPVTSKTLDQVKLAADSILKGAEGGNVSGVTLKALETQRRILNNNIAATGLNKADKAAMVTLKREFDGWLDDAFDTALVSGDPKALAALKEARGLRAEFGKRFEGGADTDRFIAGLLDGSRTPEELVNIALGASQVSKAGGARFIDRLRVAADNDPAVIGNLRAAHFLRMTQGSNGQPLPMGQLVRNIRATEYGNASVIKALYSPAEWAEVRRLASALEPLIPKGDFARTSGTTERLARMLFSRVGGGLPMVGDIVKAVGSVRATREAQRVLNEPLRLKAFANPAAPATGAAMAEQN